MRSPTLPTTGTATIIRNGETRLVRHAKVRGLPCGSNQLPSVYCPPTEMLTARWLRNSLTDTARSPGTARIDLICVKLCQTLNAKAVLSSGLSKAFEFGPKWRELAVGEARKWRVGNALTAKPGRLLLRDAAARRAQAMGYRL